MAANGEERVTCWHTTHSTFSNHLKVVQFELFFFSPLALAQGKKPKFTLLFSHATDFDTEETDQRIDKITPYCFSIIFGSVIKYFCVKSSEDFREWADAITCRIKGACVFLLLPSPTRCLSCGVALLSLHSVIFCRTCFRAYLCSIPAYQRGEWERGDEVSD